MSLIHINATIVIITAKTILICYSCNSNATHLHLKCNSFATQMQLICNSYAADMQLKCNSFASQMQLICNSNATHLQLICSWYATQMQLICNSNCPFFQLKSNVAGGGCREQADGQLGWEHQGLEQHRELPTKCRGGILLTKKLTEVWWLFKGFTILTFPNFFTNYHPGLGRTPHCEQFLATNLVFFVNLRLLCRGSDSKGWTTWTIWNKRWIRMFKARYSHRLLSCSLMSD